MKTFLRAAALAVGLFLVAGCNANSLVIIDVEGDELVVMVVEGLTTWPQSVPPEGGESLDHPSGANIWDIDDDFALHDGGDDQFDDALSLTVGATSFPFDQDYSDLTFYAPVITGADGLVAAVVDDGTYRTPLSGTYTALLAILSFAQFCQVIDLTGATAPISLDWEQDVDIDDGRLSNEPDYFLRVAIRDLAGGLLATAFEAVNSNAGDGIKSFDISAYAGMTVRVCFEQRSSDDSDGSGIDDVSVTDFTATEFITNGGFETGDFTGWELTLPLEPGHMKSGMRTVEGLEVMRWFHTRPNAKWGRWVDSFHNPTGAPIVKTIEYETDLGSDDYGIIYVTDLTGGKAISEWDGDDSDRDIGWVHGIADLVDFTSDDFPGCGCGEEEIFVEFDIVVAPGATVRIVQFIVMNGVQTDGIDEDELATDIDAVNQWIVANWGFAPILTDGMTAAEIASVVNW